NKYILTMVCYFTKQAVAVALPNMREDTVADAFSVHWICQFGAPSRLISDNGSNICGKIAAAVCKIHAIQHLTTTTYHPQTDGLCEKNNGTIGTMLSKFV